MTLVVVSFVILVLGIVGIEFLLQVTKDADVLAEWRSSWLRQLGWVTHLLSGGFV